MYCKNCGAEISEDSKFCKECGVKVSDSSKLSDKKDSSSSEKIKFCSQCGADVSDDIKFCSECGADLSNMSKDESKKENKFKLISSDKVNVKKDAKRENPVKRSKINKNHLIIGGIVVLILVIGSFLLMELSKPPAVTYENYPDIPKEVIDSFNSFDVNNDTFIVPREYGAKGYSSVWYALVDGGYANHTVKLGDSEVSAMDINDYNIAYKKEQKLIKEEKAKIEAKNKKENEEWEQAYQNWYSRYGNPNLDDSQNRIRFQNSVYNRVFGYSYGFGGI